MARIKSGFTGERAIILPLPIIDEYKKTELGSLLHITDIGIYPKANFHFRKRTKEEVSQYILMYCVEGQGWFEINNQIQTVQANQAFILPKEVSHSYGSTNKNPWTIYWIHFDGQKAGFFAEGFGSLNTYQDNLDFFSINYKAEKTTDFALGFGLGAKPKTKIKR